MTKKHSTKRSLIASILVLCLCLTSLIGTTFAWFTDSVTSSGNIIKSGTLDVEMYWAAGTEAPASASWTDASTGAIFKNDKWEPGYTEARHIKIANEGTLALKYMIKIEANDEVSELADVIDVYYFDPATSISERAELDDAHKLGTLTDVLAGMEVSASGNLPAGADHTITLALKMQESAGNEYQNKSIGSTFSIVLLATQLTAENDSFGNDYDDEAKYPEISIKNETHTGEVETKLADEDVQVVIPEGAAEGNYALEVSEPSETVDSNGNTTVTLDITLKRDGVKVTEEGTTKYTVSVNIGAGYNLTGVFHNGVKITEYEYDITSGIITFETSHFSPFSFTYDEGKKVESAASLAEQIANGGIIQLSGDVTLEDAPLVIKNSVVLNLNGYTISGKSTSSTTSYLIKVESGAELMIQNGTVSFYATTPDTVWGGEGQPAFPGYSNNTISTLGKLIVNNATIENTTAAGGASYAIDAYPGADVVINGDKSCIDGCGKNAIRMFANSATIETNVTINGGTVTGTRAVWVQLPGSNASVAMLANLTVNGGKLISTDEKYNLVIYSYSYGNSFAKTNIALNGGSFDGNVAFGGGAKDSVENVSINWAKCTFKGEYGVFRYTADGSQDYVKVTTADELKAAVEAGNIAVLVNDIVAPVNTSITVKGVATIDLNGYTLSSTSDKTGANYSLIVANGKNAALTVKNGTVTIKHIGDNMGWNNSTNVLEAVSGATLVLDHVNVKNLGGSDMAYGVNIANNGGATLTTIASTIESANYTALRIFNNADGAINVNLTNGSELKSESAALFVHFWSAADLGDKQAARQAYLKLNLNDTKVSRYSGSLSVIRFGFTDAIYYADVAMTTVVAGTEAALKWALANEKNVILNNDLLNIAVDTTAPYGNKLGISVNGETIDGKNNVLDFNSPSGDNYGIMISEGTIKDVTVGGVFRGIVIMNPNNDIYINNVVISDKDVCYAINTAEGDGQHSLYVNNSTICGWTSIGTAVKDVYFTNCTFGQGEYYNDVYGRLVKPYVNTVFENCDFSSQYYIDLSALSNGATVTLKNCRVNGVTINAENFAQFIAPESTCGAGQISVELKDGTYLTAENLVDYIIFE